MTAPATSFLSDIQDVGHADHWRLLSDDLDKIPDWLAMSLDKALLPQGLGDQTLDARRILLGASDPLHLVQILDTQDGKPTRFVNAYPAVLSPYGITCQIGHILAHSDTDNAILTLITEDGTQIFAFDTLYTVNKMHYVKGAHYYVNLSGIAHTFAKSDQSQSILVKDPKAVRYHIVRNEILSEHEGISPDDLEEQIIARLTTHTAPAQPIEINLGHMCAYLFGEVAGQEDEAWCQGQVLGKSTCTLFGREFYLFDVVILREEGASPVVVRICAAQNDQTCAIEVQDYIQTNLWLQAAIYKENQS